MARPYRFYLLSYIFLAVIFAVSLAHAQDDMAYTVEGVRVDVTADNAVNARQQAFDKAQQDAFAQLSARLSPGQPVAAPPPTTIATMVDDFEITQEQLSPVRYVGTYTFRFRPGAIQAWLGAHAAVPAPTAMTAPGTLPAMAPVTPPMTAPAAPAPVQTGMEGAWQPQRPGTPAAATTGLTARIRYNSLAEWIAAQGALRRVPGLGLDVVSLTSGEALMTLRSSLPEEQLRLALAQQGFTLAMPQGGAGWTQDASAVRDLTFSR